MSPARQEELSVLLQAAYAMEAVQALGPDGRLLRIHYDWLEAGEIAQRTVARLSEQLRRYLDDQAWLENRRIMDLIRHLEQSALAVRANPPPREWMPLNEAAPQIGLAMDRPLFTPPEKIRLDTGGSDEQIEDITLDALFATTHVDKGRLERAIGQALRNHAQVSLEDLLQAHPLEQGLAELVTYLSLAADDAAALIDEAHKATISWRDEEGSLRRARMPAVIFRRAASQMAVVA